MSIAHFDKLPRKAVCPSGRVLGGTPHRRRPGTRWAVTEHSHRHDWPRNPRQMSVPGGWP